MKSALKLATVALLASASSLFAITTYNVYTDATGDIQFYQPGGDVAFTNSYVFEVGAFSAGTDFSSAASISSSFVSFGASGNWDTNFQDVGFGAASLSFAFDEFSGYAAGITAGTTQLYIWAYDTKSVTPDADWVIITNPGWVAQPIATGAAVTSFDYTITDAGTVYVFGTLNGNKVVSALAAVPEPSAFAAIAGLAVLGGVATRRRRSA